MILLWRKARHTDKENIIFIEPFSHPPFFARNLRSRIAVRRNAVRDYAASLDSIKPPQTVRHFFRNRNRDNSVLQCITLKPAKPGLNLAFSKIVDRVKD